MFLFSKLQVFESSLAATAKSLQSCPTLCDPIDGSPPGSPIPGILQARTLKWVAISFSNASFELIFLHWSDPYYELACIPNSKISSLKLFSFFLWIFSVFLMSFSRDFGRDQKRMRIQFGILIKQHCENHLSLKVWKESKVFLKGYF